MQEAINNRNEDVVEKEKVMFPEIVVRGTDDKPYYEIKYYDVTDKQWHLGYGSYNLEYVMQWKEECLEVVEGSITNELCEKIKERLEEEVKYQNEKAETSPPFCKLTFEEARRKMAECYEHAIEIVNQVAEEYQECALCYFGNPCEYQNKDARMPESELNNGWIPCSERLPDTEHKPHKPVLVQLKMSMVIGYANSAGQWFADCGDGCSLDVTDEAIAWQPLPEPYEGE